MIWAFVAVVVVAVMVWAILRYTRFTDAMVDGSHQRGHIPMRPDDKKRR